MHGELKAAQGSPRYWSLEEMENDELGERLPVVDEAEQVQAVGGSVPDAA